MKVEKFGASEESRIRSEMTGRAMVAVNQELTRWIGSILSKETLSSFGLGDYLKFLFPDQSLLGLTGLIENGDQLEQGLRDFENWSRAIIDGQTGMPLSFALLYHKVNYALKENHLVERMKKFRSPEVKRAMQIFESAADYQSPLPIGPELFKLMTATPETIYIIEVLGMVEAEINTAGERLREVDGKIKQALIDTETLSENVEYYLGRAKNRHHFTVSEVVRIEERGSWGEIVRSQDMVKVKVDRNEALKESVSDLRNSRQCADALTQFRALAAAIRDESHPWVREKVILERKLKALKATQRIVPTILLRVVEAGGFGDQRLVESAVRQISLEINQMKRALV